MPYYKDKENKVHFLEDKSFLHILPVGSISITEREAKELTKPSLEEVLLLKKAEASIYLSSTDWYIIRKLETGKEIPEEILAKRQEAKSLLQG